MQVSHTQQQWATINPSIRGQMAIHFPFQTGAQSVDQFIPMIVNGFIQEVEKNMAKTPLRMLMFNIAANNRYANNEMNRWLQMIVLNLYFLYANNQQITQDTVVDLVVTCCGCYSAELSQYHPHVVVGASPEILSNIANGINAIQLMHQKAQAALQHINQPRSQQQPQYQQQPAHTQGYSFNQPVAPQYATSPTATMHDDRFGTIGGGVIPTTPTSVEPVLTAGGANWNSTPTATPSQPVQAAAYAAPVATSTANPKGPISNAVNETIRTNEEMPYPLAFNPYTHELVITITNGVAEQSVKTLESRMNQNLHTIPTNFQTPQLNLVSAAEQTKSTARVVQLLNNGDVPIMTRNDGLFGSLKEAIMDITASAVRQNAIEGVNKPRIGTNIVYDMIGAVGNQQEYIDAFRRQSTYQGLVQTLMYHQTSCSDLGFWYYMDKRFTKHLNWLMRNQHNFPVTIGSAMEDLNSLVGEYWKTKAYGSELLDMLITNMSSVIAATTTFADADMSKMISESRDIVIGENNYYEYYDVETIKVLSLNLTSHQLGVALQPNKACIVKGNVVSNLFAASEALWDNATDPDILFAYDKFRHFIHTRDDVVIEISKSPLPGVAAYIAFYNTSL
jgi:Txe/YoeB family toxin of Txe-Axe toxin-antitoxin module